MLLPSRNLRSRKRKFLMGMVASCCVCCANANSIAATDSNLDSSTQQSQQNHEDKYAELTLRPARPLSDESKTKSTPPSDPTKGLPFRRPVIRKTEPAASSAGVRLPAKTVSNRTPSTVPSNRSMSGGWVARDAVNLNQPLRDPDNQAMPSQLTPNSYGAPNQAVTKSAPSATVMPPPSYVGDRSIQQDLPPKNKTATAPAEPSRVRPTLVLPKDRKPLMPPQKTDRAPRSETSADAKSIQNASKRTKVQPLVESATKAAAPDSSSESKPEENDRSRDESRVDRILEELLPADGTATDSIAIPESSAPTKSTLQLSAPSELDSAQQSLDESPDRIASSKADVVVIRKLRIDSDGSKAVKNPAKSTVRHQIETDSPSRDAEVDAARSYLGDLDPGEVGSVDAPATAHVSLDYTGMPKSPWQVSYPVRRLQGGMSRVLNYYYQRPEVADGRSNWGMLHSIMVYGTDTRVEVGNQTHSAIAWIAGNNFCRGQQLAEDTEDGIRIKSGVGLQGHQAQMLAVFSLCGVPLDYPIYAGGKQYSVNDVLKAEMDACRTGEELTFTLIALSHYLDSDHTWVAADGQTWSVERLIEEELSQPIVGAACGGTHRLMGFSHALRNRRMQGKPITGQWARADKFTQDFVQYAYQLQNRDGSMSTDWFAGREDNGDVDRKLQTTGHIVEWLLTVTPDSQLENPRLVQAIRFLLSSMYGDLQHDWSIGPKGHALRSLAIYHQRVFGTVAMAIRGDGSASRQFGRTLAVA